MGKVRWGIVSTADIARTQVIPAILHAGNAELAAIASLSGRAQKTALEFNIPNHYDDYEEMLANPEIDAVYIPLPNHLHKQWVIEAAKQGKHVMVEKPAALSAEDVVEMVNVCRENNVKFMEAFMYQFHPQHQRVREILASGEIGEVKLMRASFSFFLEQKDGNIRMDKAKGGGSIYDLGCYCIHAIRNVLDSEPVTVESYAEFDSQTGVDVSAIGVLKLENGAKAVFDCSFEMAFKHEYEIVGTKGRIVVPRAFRPDVHGGEGLIIVQNDSVERTERVYGDLYLQEVEYFSNAILEDEPIRYTGENIIHNMRAIDACYHSLKNR
ncbi:Gfo/Idh/MocA family oxidoreductase [Bacillus salipaludis]|uniref:Gfo/Idh/MocA family protein n=1 Tax=Bacillus salipaludis TaxID=2547811 RepID=UPI003D1D8CEE